MKKTAAAALVMITIFALFNGLMIHTHAFTAQLDALQGF